MDDDILQIIGRNIAVQRNAQKLTQAQLADKLTAAGCKASTSDISRIERGITAMRIDAFHTVCKVLGCTSYQLYPRSDYVTAREIRALRAMRQMSPRQQKILLYLMDEWQGDTDALWELGLVYATLPDYRRDFIVNANLEEYRECKREDPDALDDAIEIDLAQIIKAHKKLKK